MVLRRNLSTGGCSDRASAYRNNAPTYWGVSPSLVIRSPDLAGIDQNGDRSATSEAEHNTGSRRTVGVIRCCTPAQRQLTHEQPRSMGPLDRALRARPRVRLVRGPEYPHLRGRGHSPVGATQSVSVVDLSLDFGYDVQQTPRMR